MNIYQKALSHYGANEQSKIAIEECGELILEFSHFFNRGRGSKEGCIEEIADVLIVARQFREYFGPELVDAMIDRKLARLNDRIEAKDG